MSDVLFKILYNLQLAQNIPIFLKNIKRMIEMCTECKIIINDIIFVLLL